MAIYDNFDTGTVDAKWIQSNAATPPLGTWSFTESSSNLNMTFNGDALLGDGETRPQVAQAGVLASGEFDVRMQFTVDSSFDIDDSNNFVVLYAAEDRTSIKPIFILGGGYSNAFGVVFSKEEGSAYLFTTDGSSQGDAVPLGDISSVYLRLKMASGQFTAYYALNAVSDWITLSLPATILTTAPQDLVVRAERTIGDTEAKTTTVKFDWVTENSETAGWPGTIVSDEFNNGFVDLNWTTGNGGNTGTVTETSGSLVFTFGAGMSTPLAAQPGVLTGDFDLRAEIYRRATTGSMLFFVCEDYTDTGAHGAENGIRFECEGSDGGRMRRSDITAGSLSASDFTPVGDTVYVRIVRVGTSFALYTKQDVDSPWRTLPAPAIPFTTSQADLDILFLGYQASGAPSGDYRVNWMLLNGEGGTYNLPWPSSYRSGDHPWSGKPWSGMDI